MASSNDQSLQLILIPWPVMGHVQIVEFAKILLPRTHLHLPPGKKLSITVLLMRLPDSIDTVSSSFSDQLSASSACSLRFHNLPPIDPTPEWSSRTRGYFIHNLVLSQRSNVAEFLHNQKHSIAGVIVDMLCTSMIAVAEEMNISSYIFFTSPASFLGAMLHFQALTDEKNQNVAELRNSETDLLIPSFAAPVPPNVLPQVIVNKEQWLTRFLHYARDYRKARGIIINTFLDLEPYALNSFLVDSSYGSIPIPPIFAVGPITNQAPFADNGGSQIVQWLDKQAPRSVVFVCFGSQGSLDKNQIQELAKGLEQTGARFLWSLRRQPPKTQLASFPTEYTSYEEVLPKGFLERTAGVGIVVGWVPQLEVLGHTAIGGFVSHCGWNSVLESLWFGVPIATWPLHSEQQMNAFQLVKELGLAEEISISYLVSNQEGIVIMADEIERGIKAVMAEESEVRKRMIGMKEKSRRSVDEGGFSHISLSNFIEHLMCNSVCPL